MARGGMIAGAVISMAIVASLPNTNAQTSYVDNMACFCGTISRADDKLEEFMKRPVETLKVSLPMFELGLFDANSTVHLQYFLFSQVIAYGVHLETTAEEMMFVGLRDGRFVGFSSDVELMLRGPYEGAAADVLLNQTLAHSTWSNSRCGVAEPRKQITTATCPTAEEIDCTGCGLSVANLGPIAVNASSCCDTNIRATFSTNQEHRGLAIDLTTWKLYDPRVRPWFTSAVSRWQANSSSSKIGWSTIYQFSTTKMLGITATATIIVDGNLIGVFGID